MMKTLEDDKHKIHIRLFPEEDGIKISGSINLGYIGKFSDSQIEIEDSPKEIREWDIVTENLDANCTDEELSITDWHNFYINFNVKNSLSDQCLI